MKIKIIRTNNILKRIGKKTLVALATFILVILPVTLLILFNSPKGVEAAWANEDWGYRYPITVTNSTGSTQTNLQKLLTIDTSTLVTAGKLQSDCDDLRFTAQNGTVLPYYIDSGCNTTTTKVWVLLDSVPTNGSVIYMYYGNPGATIGSNAKEFDNVVGLVGYWTMNDTSGSTATDSSMNANNGTATGTTIVSGQKGNARSFNGTSDYVSVADNDVLDVTTTFTYSFWVKRSGGLGTLQDLTDKSSPSVGGGQTSGGLTIYFGTSNKLNAVVQNVSGIGNGTNTTISDTTTWHHLVVTRDSSNTWKFYIDGVLDSTVTNTANTSGNNNALRFGAHVGANRYANILLDDVHIYNTARTADQISSDYTKTYTIQTSPLTVTTANGSEEKAPSPVAYWKFDDGTGTTAQDSTTNNNDGTLTNGPSWQTEDMCVSGKCLKFDGTDDYVDAGDKNLYSSTALSVCSWVRPNLLTASTSFRVVSKGDASNYEWSLYLFGDDPAFVLWQSSGSNYMQAYDSNVNLSLNTWYYICGTTDGTTTKVYMNGIERASTTTTSGTRGTNGTATLQIGRVNATSGEYFKGFIDEPKIYNYARSADQVKADYANRGGLEGASSVIASATNGARGNLSNGLVGYWKMDESSWTNNCTATSVTDSSGNGNNGKACPATTGPTGGAAGKFGNAGSFDGSNDYVSVADTASLRANTALTVALWVNPTAIPNPLSYFISKSSWSFGINGNYSDGGCLDGISGKVFLWTGASVCSSTTISTNTWSHIVFTNDGTITKIYVNGVLSGSGSQTISSNSGTNLEIGRRTDGSWHANSKIDETRIYNRALSPAEVTQLYNFAPGPVAYYNFEENTGTTVNDRSGNGNTGTWNGSGSPKWKPGKYGAAGNFDGSSDYVSVADNTSVSVTGTGLSIKSWIKLNSASVQSAIVEKYDVGSVNGYILRVQSNGILLAGVADAAGFTTITGSTTLSANSWYHVAMTYDGANIRIYLNGKLDNSSAATKSITDGTTAFRIGGEGAGNPIINPMNGQIDDVKIYNYARTQDQIISDMQGSSGTAAFSLSSSGLTGGSNTKPAAPVGYWKFDEGYSTTANNVGNGGTALNGTLTNMSSPATSTSGWTQSGKFNKALVFDGSNDYVSVASSSSLDFSGSSPSNNFTFTAWVKPTTVAGEMRILGKGRSAVGDGYLLYLSGGQTIILINNGSTAASTTDTTPLTANQWSYVSATYDGATLKIYVNGVLKASTSTTISPAFSSSVTFNIGTELTSGPFFSGQIDEVKVYNFALTADQVKMDMNQGAAAVYGNLGNASTSSANSAAQEYCVPGDTATCSAPVGRWDFEEGTGTSASDQSGNNNTGTLTNGPTWVNGKAGNGKAINFDGSDDQVSISNSSSIQVGGGNFTLEAWIYPNSFGSYKVVFDKGTGGAREYGFYINSSTDGWVGYGNSSGASLTFSTPFTTKEWQHVTVRRSSSTVDVYRNGILVGTITGATTGTNTATLSIGYNTSTGGTQWDGQIDQVRIFNYARSASQIAWDYNKGAPVGHWRLDECQGTSAKDVSGNNNTGTITIGSSGTQTTAGTCTDGSSASAWYNGRTGKKNYSLNFDGTDDKITVNALTGKYSTQVTVAAWAKHGTGSGWDDIVAGGCNDVLLSFSGASIVWGLNCGTTTSAHVLDNSWHHLVGTYNGSTFRLYVDGVLVKSFNSTTTLVPANLGIGGAAGAADEYFIGQIDDVRVYNYALTSTQVKNLFNDGAYRVGPTTGAP